VIRRIVPDALIRGRDRRDRRGDALVAMVASLLEETVGALAKEAMAAVFAGVAAPARPPGRSASTRAPPELLPEAALVRVKTTCYVAGAPGPGRRRSCSHDVETTATRRSGARAARRAERAAVPRRDRRGARRDVSAARLGNVGIGAGPMPRSGSITRRCSRITRSSRFGETLVIEDRAAANGTRIPRSLLQPARDRRSRSRADRRRSVMVVVQQRSAPTQQRSHLGARLLRGALRRGMLRARSAAAARSRSCAFTAARRMRRSRSEAVSAPSCARWT